MSKRIFSLFFLLVFSIVSSQNLLTNGNFENPNVVGFSSNGAGYVRIFPPFSGTTNSGNWAFTSNPQPMNTASFISSGDHTTGSGLMLVFDGNTTGGQQNFWEAGNGGSGVCGLTVGATYTFSYWVRSVYNSVSGNPTPADIRVQILNSSSVLLVSGNTIAPPTASGWQQVIYSFVPNSSCVNIKLYNENTNAEGNDFAIDDIAVLPPPTPLSQSVSFNNPSCINSSNGSIISYGIGGVLPYTSYTLTGTVFATSSNGIFTNLPQGSYTVTVTDSNGSTAQTSVVLSEPSNIIASQDATICSGQSITLGVSGSTSGYTWTSQPVDNTISNPSIANPTVSPSQTTTYTVTSTVNSTLNLITNGDFSSGNTGFLSDYQFLTTTTPVGAQKTYGIVNNSNSWFPSFSSCLDHSGTGAMMVVDGSTTNAVNDLVWGQTVLVNGSTNYQFSFWLQTVATPNPASIKVVINGVSVGTFVAPSTTCNWVNYSVTWNSGASSSANIQIFDLTTTASGNDFAIDDITFTYNNSCVLSDQVVVTVNNPTSPVITCGNTTSNSINFTWNSISGASNYAISYSINGGAVVNAGTTANTNFTVSSLNNTDNVTITVLPTGTGCYLASTQTCSVIQNCPTPVATVTQQPTCAVPTGIIVFTPPTQPLPTDLFISEVTDASVGLGALSYIEIFNGTGAPKNLANYKIAVYNNGNNFISNNCDIVLTGILNNNDVFVLALGSNTNQGGVIPDMAVASCAAFNTDDNVRLTSSSNVLIDTWGRNDGIDFTPNNEAGYTYRRLNSVVAPSTVWNPADWTTLDPEDYSNVGTYAFSSTGVFEYSIDGINYQTNPIFTGVAPGTYNGTIRDVVSGCISTSITLIVNPLPVVPAPTVAPISYCQNSTASPLTATPVAGGTLNWYGTNATGGTASSLAPIPSTVTVGPITYYVSQTVGGCESPRAAIVVTISSSIIPTFIQLGPFCEGQTVPALPSTSSNSITGTWSPSTIDNTTTTTYTFTPNAGQCELTSTMTIVINPNPTLVVTNPSVVCSPAIVDLTLASVTAGSSTGTLTYWINSEGTTVLNNPSAITTSGTFYIKLTNGNCSTIQPVVVTISSSSTLVITNPPAVCSPSTVDLTLASVTAGSSTGTLSYWTNAAGTTVLNNPNAVTSSGTYYIRLTNGSCSTIQPVVVTISSSPTLIITNPPAVCSPSTVDLTQASVTAGSSAGTLSYWTNAAGTTVLNNPNAVTSSGTYYIRLT
uniref:Ig-like domain-containing protein n=1 Tax=Flavobacterium macrobrachii TaxID=591204 RepID=UPI0037C010D9